MLQASEYDVNKYLRWYWKTSDFSKVSVRKSLDLTSKAKLLLASSVLVQFILLFLSFWLIFSGLDDGRWDLGSLGVGLLLLSPILTAHLLVIPLWIGTAIIQKPQEDSALKIGSEIFAKHPGTTIAVAGSYGKTTTKEVLKVVLGQKLKVRATEGNLNTLGALANFAQSLDGDEDVLIVELGEFEPGDIGKYADLVKPDIGIITGLAEAHLDTLGDLDTAAENLLSLSDFVGADSLFINHDSKKITRYLDGLEHTKYSKDGTLGWTVSNIETSLEGTKFNLKKGKSKMKVSSELMGGHLVAVLSLAAGLARKLKIKKNDVEKAIMKTKPFEHRLQLARNDEITIIDDTYNGNIEGVKVAAEFIDSLDANKKMYVTPGLVEQGEQTEDIHKELGNIIAPIFDSVVLMKNQVTEFIESGLKEANFDGKLTIVEDPVDFYENINSYTTDGDVVLMQNDLPDVYVQT